MIAFPKPYISPTMRTPTLLATIATLTFAPLLSAYENHGTEHGHGSKIEVAIPEKVADLWKSIETEHATLSVAIAAQISKI